MAELTQTSDGGIVLPSGDIHQAHNGIYTVIPSENTSLLLASAANLEAVSIQQQVLNEEGNDCGLNVNS